MDQTSPVGGVSFGATVRIVSRVLSIGLEQQIRRRREVRVSLMFIRLDAHALEWWVKDWDTAEAVVVRRLGPNLKVSCGGDRDGKNLRQTYLTSDRHRRAEVSGRLTERRSIVLNLKVQCADGPKIFVAFSDSA